MAISKVRELIRGPYFSRSSHPPTTLATNYSFVLHEPSSSRAVAMLVSRNRGAGVLEARRRPTETIIGVEALAAAAPDTILTARIGDPLALQDIIARIRPAPQILTIDATGKPAASRTFFGAPAQLVLPSAPSARLIVAAAIVRPGGGSVDLVSFRPFRWPEDCDQILAALEQVIRSHVDQWLPSRALWDAPSEELLPEVLDDGPSSTTGSR